MVESLPPSMTDEYQKFFLNLDAFNTDRTSWLSPKINFAVYVQGMLLYAGLDRDSAVQVHKKYLKDGTLFEKINGGEWK